jgi:hypothetical protein
VRFYRRHSRGDQHPTTTIDNNININNINIDSLLDPSTIIDDQPFGRQLPLDDDNNISNINKSTSASIK